MGQIQSNIGLITGFPIVDTVDQLVSVSAQSRDKLIARTAQLSSEQVAITQLMSFLVAFQGATNNLAANHLFETTRITSSNDALLTATVSSDRKPLPGGYLFTPLQRATSQQVMSQSFPHVQDMVGAGTLTLQMGGFVDQGIELGLLNEGRGVRRGEIRITDRSGTSAVVDLRQTRTIDDVLEMINKTREINVTAEIHGDRIRVLDNTQQSVTKLRVQDVNGGFTASDLGLADVDSSLSEIDGNDVLRLHHGIKLSQLNGGNGLTFHKGVEDLRVTFRDGSEDLDIDVTEEATLGELLATLNSDERLTVEISAGGDQLQLTDQTMGMNGFSITSLFGGTLAQDLGIGTTDTGADGVIMSGRLQAGLKGALLRNLNGGFGIESLGQIDITDRSGNTAIGIDLSTAETLQDVIDAINDGSIEVRARVNDARNGIVLEDTSGGTHGLVVANADASNTADRLGIRVNAAQNVVNSGSLGLQTVHENMLLSSLNGGSGVDVGSLRITSSHGGKSAVVKLDQPGAEITKIGGVIDAVNSLNIGVLARVNDTGNGIVLVDTAAGSGTLIVEEVDGTTAADLGIHGSASQQLVGGKLVDAIDGSAQDRIEIAADDTLDDLLQKINDSTTNATAFALFDGHGYRLSLVSNRTGRAGELLIDVEGSGLSFHESSRARDALLAYGLPEVVASSVVASSGTNTFSDIVDGIDITLHGTADEAVTIRVEPSVDNVLAAAKTFVESYNAVVENIDSMTFFNENDNTTGVLFGSSAVLRVESGLSKLLTGSFLGLGKFTSLEEVGIETDQSGKLALDSTKLTAAFEDAPEALEMFFTKQADQNSSTLGVSAKIEEFIDLLAGGKSRNKVNSSVLMNRVDTLTKKINSNNDRVEILNRRLEAERELLLNQFYQMERIIGQLQNNLSSLRSLTVLSPLGTKSSTGLFG